MSESSSPIPDELPPAVKVREAAEKREAAKSAYDLADKAVFDAKAQWEWIKDLRNRRHITAWAFKDVGRDRQEAQNHSYSFFWPPYVIGCGLIPLSIAIWGGVNPFPPASMAFSGVFVANIAKPFFRSLPKPSDDRSIVELEDASKEQVTKHYASMIQTAKNDHQFYKQGCREVKTATQMMWKASGFIGVFLAVASVARLVPLGSLVQIPFLIFNSFIASSTATDGSRHYSQAADSCKTLAEALVAENSLWTIGVEKGFDPNSSEVDFTRFLGARAAAAKDLKEADRSYKNAVNDAAFDLAFFQQNPGLDEGGNGRGLS